jgi:hypothetical protein
MRHLDSGTAILFQRKVTGFSFTYIRARRKHINTVENVTFIKD